MRKRIKSNKKSVIVYIVLVIAFFIFIFSPKSTDNVNNNYISSNNKTNETKTTLVNNSKEAKIENKVTKITDISNEKIKEIKSKITSQSSLEYKSCGGEFEGECLDKANKKYYVQTKTKDAIPAKTEKVIVEYRTLCNDGEYSPSNAKGRGACSHHGGVANWNAPVYDTNYIPEVKAEYKKDEIKFEDTEVYKTKYNSITDEDVINYYNLYK